MKNYDDKYEIINHFLLYIFTFDLIILIKFLYYNYQK